MISFATDIDVSSAPGGADLFGRQARLLKLRLYMRELLSAFEAGKSLRKTAADILQRDKGRWPSAHLPQSTVRLLSIFKTWRESGQQDAVLSRRYWPVIDQEETRRTVAAALLNGRPASPLEAIKALVAKKELTGATARQFHHALGTEFTKAAWKLIKANRQQQAAQDSLKRFLTTSPTEAPRIAQDAPGAPEHPEGIREVSMDLQARCTRMQGGQKGGADGR